MERIFYSQQGEDVYVYNNYINLPNKDAVFVELGGFDGVTYSNSKFFEDYLQFNGVLIEPTNAFDAMIKHRPNCKSYNLAVSKKNELVSITGDSATAGLTDTLHPDFLKRWHSSSKSYMVQSKPFRDILKDSGIQRIDLLSIDVEGGELGVLETMDFSIPVYVIVLEADNNNKGKNEACRNILRKNGFVFDRHFCLNDIWYNPAYPYIDSVYKPAPIPTFNSLFELGRYKSLASHCVTEIQDALRQGRTHKA
jgi:FkbM family methyltransferase